MHMAARTKQYLIAVSPATDTARTSPQPIPQNPSRCFLYIQNTGANPGLVQFTNRVKGDGSDLLFAPGDTLQFDQYSDDGFNGPTEAVNFGSALGTSFAVLEGVRHE